MTRDGRSEGDNEEPSELEETELLEARRRRLGEKLFSRGLIKNDPKTEDQAKDNPAGA